MSTGRLDELREKLCQAARGFTDTETLLGDVTGATRALCDAASAYAAERQAHAKPTQNSEAAGVVIPFGRSKGTPLAQANEKDLRYVLGIVTDGLDDPAKARFRSKNEALIAAIERELATR